MTGKKSSHIEVETDVEVGIGGQRYAIHNQRDRRNLEGKDLFRLIAEVDKRKKAGRPDNLASSDANYGKSAQETAEIVGTSQAKVERTRTVIDHADEETKQAVAGG